MAHSFTTDLLSSAVRASAQGAASCASARSAVAGLLALAAVGLGGCGDPAMQTRYVPKASQLSWDEDIKQLPWQEPSKGDAHYARNGKGHIPREAHMLQYNVNWGVYGYHFEGDGSAAEGGGGITAQQVDEIRAQREADELAAEQAAALEQAQAEAEALAAVAEAEQAEREAAQATNPDGTPVAVVPEPIVEPEPEPEPEVNPGREFWENARLESMQP